MKKLFSVSKEFSKLAIKSGFNQDTIYPEALLHHANLNNYQLKVEIVQESVKKDTVVFVQKYNYYMRVPSKYLEKLNAKTLRNKKHIRK